MDTVKNQVSQSVGASVTDQRVSGWWRPKDRLYVLVTVILSAVSKTTGITLKLKDSFDGGQTAFDVGDQSQVTITSKTFASSTDVDASTDEITLTSHGYATGERLILVAGTAVPPGLTDGATYYAIEVDADTLKLAMTQEDALDGTSVDITDVGTGTQTLYNAQYEIRMIKDDATDLAQLPLQEHVALFVSSGASDSCTVANVYVPET